MVLILISIVLLVLLISTRISMTAYIAWTVENDFKQPSDEDMQRLVRWCIKKYIEDLFRKS